MPTYNWTWMQQRSGDSIESLVATLLVLEYPGARQVNPSSGDGGIDVIRETPEGIIVWQVKKFTTPLTPGQFDQVSNSWTRFTDENVGPGKPSVLEYHLVTPWTPTEGRYEDFHALTAQATFPTAWEGDAFLSGLADKHPATVHRFTYGEGALEQFVTQKAMLANSPVEDGESISMIGAIETRQGALDQLRETISDHYRIDHGTRTTTGDGLPALDPEDPAIFHRMTYLGEGRWSYQSLVPRGPDSTTLDPVSWEVTFLDPPGTPGFEAVQAWAQWGTPFGEVRGEMRMIGGPLPDTGSESGEQSWISFVGVEREDDPALFLRCTTPEGATRFRIKLDVTTRTVGAETRWVHLVASTPERTLTFEAWLKPDEVEGHSTIGDMHGRDPESVGAEARILLSVQEADLTTIEVANLGPFLTVNRLVPSLLDEAVVPVADALTALQRRTSSVLTMPDIMTVTHGQLRRLLRYQEIYAGNSLVSTWETWSVTAPSNVEDLPGFIEELSVLLGGDYRPVEVREPVLTLGDDTFKIDHPTVTTRAPIRLGDGFNLLDVRPSDVIEFVPADDDSQVTAMIVDWTPDSDVFGSTGNGAEA